MSVCWSTYPLYTPIYGTVYAIPSESGSSWLPSTAAEHIWGVLHRLIAAWRDDMGWLATKIHPFWWRKHEETREPKDLNHVLFFFLGGCHSTDTMTMTKTWEINYNWWAFIFKYHAIAYLLSFWSGVSRATLTWKASIAELSDEETITQCIECLLPSISEYTSPHLSSKWMHIAHLSGLLQVLPNLLKFDT